MAHQVTVTGKTGPDRTVTAAVITNVTQIDFQLANQRLFIHTEQGVGDNIKEFDLSLTATVTFSISSGNYTIVVSS